jgi:hypothetical protein
MGRLIPEAIAAGCKIALDTVALASMQYKFGRQRAPDHGRRAGWLAVWKSEPWFSGLHGLPNILQVRVLIWVYSLKDAQHLDLLSRFRRQAAQRQGDVGWVRATARNPPN